MEDFMIKPPAGAKKKRKIVGRGTGTRLQKTSGRGSNGQNSRSGGGVRPGFEGGQMPLYRRIARRGFSNYPFKAESIAINLDVINAKYAEGETVSLESLKQKDIIKNRDLLVKILGRGDLSKKLTFKIRAISESAKEKIVKAGGKISEESQKE
jgi:large subunit ribosomal protein L15